MAITTARDLATRLLATFDPDKPIVFAARDGVFGVNVVEEQPDEVYIFLGEMP